MKFPKMTLFNAADVLSDMQLCMYVYQTSR